MQQSVKTNKMLLALVICILTLLLQPADTKKWVQFLEEENISYNKAELDFNLRSSLQKLWTSHQS